MKNEFIDDLTKAIDLGQQMAEILKKSQMSLFGDPHHVGYERTSASGTVSHIQAKGAQGLPEHHMEASHHADNISYDLATNGLSHHTHAEAAAAHQHAMNLHHQAAKLYKEDSTPYTYHMRKNQHHFETSLEHEREQNRQDKLTANPEPTEHADNVTKLVTMTHEAVAKISAEPKMAEYKPFIDRKLEALKANPTAKAAHDVLSDVKMMVEKASEPKISKTEAEASEHLQQVANRYVKRMHSKLEKFSHADSDDARNGHPPHIPAKEVEGTEARHHTMGEVYGTHPRTYKGEIVPGGTSFSKEFMEKQEANGHKSFILKHTNGNRYLVDSQGYDYARYISKIKEEPKAETLAPTAAQSKPAIPTSRVTVETTEHEMSHGKMPKGAGRWMFSGNRKIDFANHKEGEDYIITPHMPYAEAKKHAKQWAASKGHGLIWTMP
jgi:hypothetical protein